MITANQIIKEQTALKKERSEYDKLKSLCISLAYPGRSDQMDYYAGFDSEKGKANTKSRQIYDPTAFKGLEVWSNGIIGNYMPKDINWFAEDMAERKLRESKQTKKWLQETDEHMRFTLNLSNYYEQKLVTIKDAGCIGDSFMFIEPDGETGKQMMMAPHPREFCIKRDFWGRVIMITHEFSKTMEQVVDEFGKKALSEAQKVSYNQTSKGKPIDIIHATIKNKEFDPDRPGTRYMRWLHIYVNVQGKNIMKESGSYQLNPIPWSLNRPSHEPYGRGIVSQMLIEIITANFMGKDILTASQTATRPPMLITAALQNKLDLGAGAVNFVTHDEMAGLKMGDLVTNLIDSGGYPFGIDNHMRWQQIIDERFGVPIFLALNAGDNKKKTLGEVRLGQAERVTLMAPFLGTLGGITDMEFDRIYSIEEEAGRAPIPPDEVLEAQNRRVDISYIGPLAQLLKMYYETGNLLTTIENIRAALEVAPDSSVVYDGDVLMRKILESGNAPEDLILSKEDVLEIKAMAAEQQEQERIAMLAAESSKAVPNLSKKIEKDSVLSALKEQMVA